MKTLSKITIAAALSLAALAPLTGAAHAKTGLNGFGKTLEARDTSVVPVARRRGRRVATPRIDRRIKRQARRIRRGMRRGHLTRFETVRLRGRLFGIRSVRRLAKRDGRVTRRERNRLMRLLNRNSKRIQRLSRNRRRS